ILGNLPHAASVQAKPPAVRVVVRTPGPRCSLAARLDDDAVLVGEEACRSDPDRAIHPIAQRAKQFLEYRFLALIGPRVLRRADDRPADVVGEAVDERTRVAVRKLGEHPLESLLA